MGKHGDMRDNERALPLAVVIGGAGGLGQAAVRRVGLDHAVLLADIDLDRGAALADQLCEEGLVVTAVHCDVTSQASIDALFDRVRLSGPLRSLVNVVGLSPAAGDWRAILRVNLAGARRVADAALPTFAAGGAAVFVSSIAGHRSPPSPSVLAALDNPLADSFLADLERAVKDQGADISPGVAYAFSKFGMNRMCRRLASAWGAKGVRIVSCSPGLIRTPMGEREFINSPVKFDILKQTPLQRQCSIIEVMDAVAFLLSDKASFVTGTDLLVDGGLIGSRAED